MLMEYRKFKRYFSIGSSNAILALVPRGPPKNPLRLSQGSLPPAPRPRRGLRPPCAAPPARRLAVRPRTDRHSLDALLD
jgi:hypothetical protein